LQLPVDRTIAILEQLHDRGDRMASEEIAVMNHVTKRYGEVHALSGIDVTIRRGEVLALLGPNGAGKTTAVKLLLGLTGPTSGSVRVFGGDPRDASTRTRVGTMLQVGKVPETLTVAEHINQFRAYYPAPLSTAEVIAVAGLSGMEGRRFGVLSGGQKQRVLFALAVCGNPDLLFLDEPTVGLDVEARRVFWDQVRKLVGQGRTVLLTTHYLEEADALADRIVVMNHGLVIAEGTPAQIKSRAAARRIRCVTRLTLEEIRRIPGVHEVRPQKNGIEIFSASAESIVQTLLMNDSTLSELEVTHAGLEEAFLALTSAATAQPVEAA
jgi:ABC-2 type transport system ATP-binding protein